MAIATSTVILKYLPVVIKALKEDVPNGEYMRLGRRSIRKARADIQFLMHYLPGFNYDNIKRIWDVLIYAEQENWKQLDNEVLLDDVLSEYNTLLDSIRAFEQKKKIRIPEEKPRPYTKQTPEFSSPETRLPSITKDPARRQRDAVYDEYVKARAAKGSTPVALKWLANVMDAFLVDVPKHKYSRLDRKSIIRAKRDLETLMACVPGSSSDNVQGLGTVLGLAEQGRFEELHRLGYLEIEEALNEYNALLELSGIPEAREKFEQRYGYPETPKSPSRQPMRITDFVDHYRPKSDIKSRRLATHRDILVHKQHEEIERDPVKIRITYITGKTLRNGIPADLSDTEKPKRITEIFNEIYHDEWVKALEDLSKSVENDKAIGILKTLLIQSYNKCKEAAGKQLLSIIYDMEKLILKPPGTVEDMLQRDTETPQYVKKWSWRIAKRYRTEAAPISVTPLQQDLGKQIMKTAQFDSEAIHNYVSQCVAITWIFVVQDPPMAIYWPESNRFMDEYFTPFSNKGHIIEYDVWPALRLHRTGEVLSKGVVKLYGKA